MNKTFILALSALLLDCVPPVLAKDKALDALKPSESIYVSCLITKGKETKWLKVGLPEGGQEVLATFPGESYGARVSWSPDLKEAAVWFDPKTSLQSSNTDDRWPAGYPDEPSRLFPDRLYRVELKNKRVQSVSFPQKSKSTTDQDIAYAASGELTSFDTIVDHAEEDGYSARAFRFLGGKWTLFEKKPTTSEMCDALGAGALGSHKGLGPSTGNLLEGHISGDLVTEKKILGYLKMAEPKGADSEDGAWTEVKNESGTMYVWQASLGDYAYTTGLILLERGKKLSSLNDIGFTAGDLVAIQVQGSYLLVSSANSGCHPRVYDLRTGDLVFKSNSARAVVFWPEAKAVTK